MDEYDETYSGTLPNALVLVPGTQAHRVTVNGLLVEEHRPELDAPIVYSYNGFGELMEVSSPQSGTTVYQRDELGRVSGMTAPGRGQENWTYRSHNSTASGEIASHTVWVVASGGGAAVPQRKYYQYDRLRRMTHLWGNAVPPQKFQYDGVGRLAFLTTYRQDDAAWLSSFFPTTAFAGNGDVTGWTYAGNGSRVASKVDAANNAVTYSYDTGGFLLARQWARRLPGTSTPMATFYSWQTLPGQPVRKVPGRLMQITYNDGLTAPVSHGYRRDGRVAWTQDESGLRTFTAPQPTGTAGQMAWSEQIDGASGLLRGLRLTNSGEHPGRPQSFSAKILTGTDFYQVHQTWDGLGRLEEVTFPTGEVAFTHLFGASHGGLQQVAATLTGAGASSTIYRHLDKPPSAGGHLTATYYTRGATAWTSQSQVMGWRYSLRSDGMREQVSAYAPIGDYPGTDAPPGWAWDYNSRGGVTGAARVRAGGAGVLSPANQAWGYAYDAMGNRLAATRGTLAAPESALGTGYSPNALNQYGSILPPRAVELTGLAEAAAEVTVAVDEGSAQTVDRELLQSQTAELGSFRAVIPLDNTAARWMKARVEVEPEDEEVEPTVQEGWLFALPASISPVHDEDGNLVEDARWLYTWDAENRLARMEEKGFGVAAGLDPATAPKRLRLEFGYDAQHRRIAKVVRRWESQTNTFSRVVKSRRYVYDDWNMIAELDHTTATGTGLEGSTVVRTQVWGLDLSGTPQGAGGVGGLLAVRHNGQSYAPLLDGNGNVMGLVGLGGAKEGQVVARYDYDAFGNRITNTAPELGEDVNPFGFSTKFTDEETGLVYYGFRYYAPDMGRWPSRDPIGEEGGLNLYGMVGNDAVNGVDYLGLYSSFYHKHITQLGLKGTLYGVCTNHLKTIMDANVAQDAGAATNTGAFADPDNHGDGGRITQTVNRMVTRMKDAQKKECEPCDAEEVLKLFGQILHSLQDLYSHSNYTEVQDRDLFGLRATVGRIPVWQMLDGVVPPGVTSGAYKWPLDNAPQPSHKSMAKDTPSYAQSQVRNLAGVNYFTLAKDLSIRGTRDAFYKFASGLRRSCKKAIRDSCKTK